MFDLTNVSFAYDLQSKPLNDVSLHIKEGEAVAVLGTNGCGKTTLLRLLNGLIFPSEGEYRFDGNLITREKMKDSSFSKAFHRRVGYVFQNSEAQLFCGSVEDEIAFGPRQLSLSEHEVCRRVDDCLELLEITRLRRRAPYTLSGGEKRRVAFASVLALNPDALVADEPFASLDEGGRELVIQLFQTLRDSGKTIVFATHSTELVEKVADMRFSF